MNEDQTDKAKVEALKAIRAVNWPFEIELIGFQARRLYERYRLLQKEGFTAAQALDLCWRKWE